LETKDYIDHFVTNNGSDPFGLYLKNAPNIRERHSKALKIIFDCFNMDADSRPRITELLS